MDEQNQAGQPQQGQPQQVSVERTGEIPKEAKQWAMFCHLAALVTYVGIPFGNVLGPLVIWLIKKDDYEFVRQQGKQAMNFQISMTIYTLIAVPLICLAGIGIIVLIGLGIVDLIFIILAAINAADGKDYKYPMTIQFLK